MKIEKFYSDRENDEMESRDNLTKRAMKILNKYKNHNNNIVMVSYGVLINTMLAILSENTIGTGKTKLKNACINVLACTNNLIKLEICNFRVEEFIKRDITF